MTWLCVLLRRLGAAVRRERDWRALRREIARGTLRQRSWREQDDEETRLVIARLTGVYGAYRVGRRCEEETR
jgi:hypothetical protein